MIEMHQEGDDALGDEVADTFDPSGGGLLKRAFSAPALAVASLVVGFAALTSLASASDIGYAALIRTKTPTPYEGALYRVNALVHVVIALLAIGLAVASGTRLLPPDPDDNVADPLWARAVAGAGLVVGLVGLVLAAVAYLDLMHAHPPRSVLHEFGFAN
jgi:hypothetical protein